MIRRTRFAAATLVVLGLVVLSGCAGTVSLEAAPDAVNPGCAEIIVRLPDTVGNLPKRETDAQATSAWGTPAGILLHCGVRPYGPTELPCVNVSGIDWIIDDSEAPKYRFTTFGRTPTTEVIVDANAASGTATLVDLGLAISTAPQNQKCTDVRQTL